MMKKQEIERRLADLTGLDRDFESSKETRHFISSKDLKKIVDAYHVLLEEALKIKQADPALEQDLVPYQAREQYFLVVLREFEVLEYNTIRRDMLKILNGIEIYRDALAGIDVQHKWSVLKTLGLKADSNDLRRLNKMIDAVLRCAERYHSHQLNAEDFLAESQRIMNHYLGKLSKKAKKVVLDRVEHAVFFEKHQDHIRVKSDIPFAKFSEAVAADPTEVNREKMQRKKATVQKIKDSLRRLSSLLRDFEEIIRTERPISLKDFKEMVEAYRALLEEAVKMKQEESTLEQDWASDPSEEDVKMKEEELILEQDLTSCQARL